MQSSRIAKVAALMLLASPIIGIRSAAADERSALEGARAAYAVCASWSDYYLGPDGKVLYHVPDAAPEAFNLSCQLWPGDRGAGVFILQDALIKCYGQTIAQDAIYGNATRQAVRNVQAFHGIPIDGVYGYGTRAAMVFAKYRRDNGAYVTCWGVT
jgi:peptidoglycan hydrolase-like protein with peptidoglycan-binding domain